MTKADWHGEFVFVNLPQPGRYLRASDPGFLPGGAPITEQTRDAVSVVLRPGAFSQCNRVAYVSDLLHPLASYEDRSAQTFITGSVGAFGGPPLAQTTLTLAKNELDASLGTSSEFLVPRVPNPIMEWLSFKEVVVAEATSNEKGEFQFTDLGPGWYTLTAAHDGYLNGTAKFWVARENLTKLSRLDLASPGQVVPCMITTDQSPRLSLAPRN